MNENISQQVEIGNFFSILQAKKDSFTEFMKLYEPSLAPYFNLFDFICPDEPRLSKIIAFFLDPKAGHGQGDRFLRIFLDKFIGGNKLKIFEELIEKVNITLEETTKSLERSQRRIDILLDFTKFGIGIENKPWAIDQEEQISDYNKYFEDRYKDKYCLLYLSGTGEPPAEDSLSKKDLERLASNGNFKILRYRDLVECVGLFKNHCQAEGVRYFLKDFENYLNREFGGEQVMYEKNMIIENVLSDPKNLEIALMVARFQDDIKLELLKKLKKSIENECPRDLQFTWKIENYWGIEQEFSFKKDNWKNYCICFQFERSETRDFAFGICKFSKADFPNPYSFDDKLGKGLSYEGWPWYQYFENPYNDWHDNYEPWIAIITGDMTKKILEKITMLKEAIDRMENP